MVSLTEACSSVKLTSVIIVLACLVSAKKLKFKHGPTGLSFNDGTNCTEFAKFGRFNPFSVLHEKWFVFYYWASVRPLTTYVFTAPSANHTRRLRTLLDGNCILPVMWEARQVLMEDNDGYISLLVERSDRGEYWLYPVARVKPGQKITPRDVRLKQTADNRILGLMDCAEESLIVMSRLNDVPRKGDLHAEASRLGYRSRRGRSYLYQGHEWGPVGEADEEIYWDRRVKKDASKEDNSSEENSEEVEFLPLNKPEEKKRKPKKSKAFSPPIKEDDEQCVKVVPELWNDPKPNPNPDNLLITKEELNHMDTNNSQAVEVTDGSPNHANKSNIGTESVNTQENTEPDNYQEVLATEMQLIGQNDLESNAEYPDPENENCVVCYKSQLNYMPAYIPDRTDSINNDEEEPTTEVPRGEVLHNEVQLTEFSYVTSEATTRSEVLGAEFPRVKVLETEVPFSEIPHSMAPHPEASHAKITDAIVSSAEAPDTEVPQAKKLTEKATRAETTVAANPAGPPHDMTNSSEIIILSPKTLDDLKS